jgi:hypothetical protein
MSQEIKRDTLNQPFRDVKYPRLGCNACASIVDSILADQDGLSPRRSDVTALQEFEEIMDDKICMEKLVCLPMIRLRSKTLSS